MIRRAQLLVLLGLCMALAWVNYPAQAKQPDAWITYDRAIADVTWVMEQGDHRTELTGTFSLRAPDEFSFAYQESNLSLRRIRAYRNFIVSQYQSQTSYGYRGYLLFEMWKRFFWSLTQIHQEPLVFVAAERLAHRDVDRYYVETDQHKVVWIDQQTNIPLMIMEGERATLSVTNYRFDSGDAEQYRYLELEFNAEDGSGKLTLWWGDFAAWVPVELVVRHENTTSTLTFKNWEVHTDQVGDLSVLKTLEWEISLGETAYDLKQWEDMLKAFKTVLSIDPYYLPAYMYVSYGYYNQGNYLGAIETLQQGLMLDPGQPHMLNNLAYIYMQRRVNLAEAVRMAEQAVAASRIPAYLDTLGYGYYLLGQYDQAKEILEEALAAVDGSTNPESAVEIQLHLEMVYHALEGE